MWQAPAAGDDTGHLFYRALKVKYRKRTLMPDFTFFIEMRDGNYLHDKWVPLHNDCAETALVCMIENLIQEEK